MLEQNQKSISKNELSSKDRNSNCLQIVSQKALTEASDDSTDSFKNLKLQKNIE